jgi:putative ATPase
MHDDDLFAGQRAAHRAAAEPLAARMRPRSLDEVAGQDHLVSPGTPFREMLDAGRPASMILFGPPGTGKTTLARLVASATEAVFVQLSATSAGVKDVREVIATATRRLESGDGRTVLFLDEIHRFNKAQQDALLPAVEDGTLILVGATTENPFFEVNSPLVSRSTLYRLEPLTPEAIIALIHRTLADEKRGLGADGVTIVPEAASALGERCGGDARLALTALDMAAVLAGPGGEIEVEHVEQALQRRVVRYDKAGDRHYDVISAFIKSIRGSDPDAALYWLHTMLEAGEDAEFVARRMIILASEDVGLADAGALPLAVAAFEALRVVGLPEAAFALSHAAVYLAIAPKSNSVYRAMDAARQAVTETGGARVPPHLRSAGHPEARRRGEGAGYRYPHDFDGAVVAQEYLPDGVRGTFFYRPHRDGAEGEIADRLERIDQRMGRRGRTHSG